MEHAPLATGLALGAHESGDLITRAYLRRWPKDGR